MSDRYQLTPRAVLGLRNIIEHAADRFGEEVAEGVLERPAHAFDALAENPNIGHAREDLTADRRIPDVPPMNRIERRRASA